MAIKHRVYENRFHIDYWKILSHSVNEMTGIGTVIVGGYFNKPARDYYSEPFIKKEIFIKATEYNKELTIAELYPLVMKDNFFKNNEGLV